MSCARGERQADALPGQTATWGRAMTDQADAFGFSWDRSGK
ncbi:hypothetical protein [Streptomyces lutosisoli]|uniref:Uncharacterized protein n=1 Tax=Streptomyces lutosisoli TaxID=2665721 RepID=A0ABW2VX90_9ACTN